jgi:hypothetical protein
MNRKLACGLLRIGAPAVAVGIALGVLALGVEPAPATAQGSSAPGPRDTVYLPIVSPPQSVVAPLRLSHRRGFYDAPLALDLSSATTSAVIRYTTDGTVPTETHGEVYQGPIRLDTTTTLRAVATRPGSTSSALETHTYIFVREVIRQPDQPDRSRYPIAWGYYPEGSYRGFMVPPDYGMDPKVTENPLYQGSIAGDLKAVPSLSLVTTPDDMFGAPGILGPGLGIYAFPMEEGSDWERPASVELLYPDGRPGFQIHGGVRIAGQWSRKPDTTAKHSFSLRFRKRYEGNLEFPLFPDNPVDRFDTLRLRASQSDSFHYWPQKAQYIHDQWGRDTERDMGWLAADGIFVHLYVNGLYWGMYNLTEDVTGAFAAAHLGGDEDDFDVIKGAEELAPDGLTQIPKYAVEDGDAEAFESLLAIPGAGPASDPALYDRMAGQLDIPRFIDHTLLEIYGANDDWVNKNWRAIRRQRPGERFSFLVWDIERMIQLRDSDARCGSAARPECGDIANTAGVFGLHGWLKGNPDYRQAFADRALRHLTGEGALTPQRAGARYARLAGEIDRAIVGESARWGDVFPRLRTATDQETVWEAFWKRYGRNAPQLRDPQWTLERDRLLNEFFPARTGIVLQQLCDVGLYPPVVSPRLSVLPGRGKSTLVLMEPDTESLRCGGARAVGRIYFTTDGRDPRTPGSGDPALPWSGQPSAGARAYHGPQSISGYRLVQARLAVPEGDKWLWSALVTVSVGSPRLAFSELMYHPEDGEAEFIELRNLESRPVDLSGAKLEGVSATLPAGTVIGPGGYLVLADDAEDFWEGHPDVLLAGEYDGSLSNAGEALALVDAAGQRLAQVSYRDDGFWPLSPDGLGWSLVAEDPAADPADPEGWRASSRRGGSPGAADPPPPHAKVWVNEVLAHAALPLEGAIELVNPGPEPAAVGGWFLSDDADDPRKYRIREGTLLPAGGFAVFYAEDLRTGGGQLPEPDGQTPQPVGGAVGAGFALDPAGGSVTLSSADLLGELSGSMRGVRYGPADEGMSFGRHRTSMGPAFVAQAVRTFGRDAPATVEEFRSGTGAPNAGPLVGPVVISEIMYHPSGGGDAFIEIENLSDVDVPLYDVNAPMRTWRLSSGVAFEFPLGTAIPRRGRILVAAVEPRWFLANPANAQVPLDALILGPFIGHLHEGEDTVVLSRPGTPIDAVVPWIEVDRVHYTGDPPWPTLADGRGPSLERWHSGRFGDEPTNWLALAPGGTPGRANTRPAQIFLPFSLVDGAD